MIGSDKVIADITGLLAQTVAVFNALHNQEHAWELAGYGKLEKWWDGANNDVWRIHHHLLKRLFKLGGSPPGVTADPVQAFTAALNQLQALHALLQTLYQDADAAPDYVTEDKATDMLATVEGWMVSAEKKLAQLQGLDPGDLNTPFLTQQM